MEIHQYTLSFAVSIAYFLQAIGLIFLARTSKNYKGVKHWSAGSFSIGLGFLSQFFRQEPSLENLSVIGANVFYFSGLILFYTGILQFINKKVKLLPILLFFLFYMLFILSFTLLKNDQLIRRTFNSMAYAAMLGVLAWSLKLNTVISIKRTAKVMTIFSITVAVFFILRALITIVSNPQKHFLFSERMQALTFLILLITGIVWTFASIVMVNQRMFADMEEAQNQFELIFKTIPAPMIITKIKDGTVVHFNNDFLDFTGYDASEALGKKITEILRWKNSEDLQSLKSDMVSETFDRSYELSCISKNNETRIVICSSEKILFNKQPHWLSVLRDITERKYFERQLLIKNEELVRASQSKDKFFSILAHDLRGPLSSYVDLTKILVEELNHMDTDQLKDVLDSIHKSSVNLYALIENLLEWSRMQRGLITFSPETLNVKQEISETVSSLANLAENKMVTVRINAEPNINVFADHQMLQTVLRNLLSNAIKFSNRKGIITLSTSAFDTDNVLFSVADNGIGIDNELKGKLFLINRNTGRPGTEGELSSGLGLVLCKELINKHGGKIWVESEPQKGSIFYFILKKGKN